jgi:5-methylcytosine-specific restriction endonuclease McrA
MNKPFFKLSRVPGAPVSDEELIADLRRVAEYLKTENVPRNKYKQYGEFAYVTQEQRFGGWNNALLRSGLKIDTPPPISDEELIADLHRVAQILGSETLTQAQYVSFGVHDRLTQVRRFGTWNEALLRAKLTISNRIDIPDVELFENILTLWQHYGRQPVLADLVSPPSCISERPYRRRFGSWMSALKAFVDYANGTGAESTESTVEEATETPITKTTENLIDKTSESLITESTERQIEEVIVRRHTTKRDPSLRLRWRVLQRDRFKCCDCGRSPATTLGIELHIDHNIPWSKGGETVFENLRTLCSICNLGKSNLLPEVTDLLSH